MRFRLYGALLLLVALVTGCTGGGSRPPAGPGSGDGDYVLHAVTVKDINGLKGDTTMAAADLRRDTVRAGGATVVYGADTLVYNRTSFVIPLVFSLPNNRTGLSLAGTYRFDIEDTTDFADTVSVFVADTFSITAISPANRLNPGGASISIDWDPAVGVDGYMYATIHRDSLGTGRGAADYVVAGGTQVTIPPDVFRLSDGLNPDTGWYYIFVYGYRGSPDSILASALLPVPLPDQIADNIYRDNGAFIGRIGSVVVSYVDSMRVAVQP